MIPGAALGAAVGGLEGRAVLDLADAARHATPARAALAVLAASDPALDPAAAAALDLGTRDARLLDARTRWFGPLFNAVAACPACGLQHDIRLHADGLRLPPPPSTEVLQAERDGIRATFRLPTTDDLLAIEAEPDPAARKRALLARLLIDGVPCPVTEDLVAEGCEQAAPQSDVCVPLSCAGCGHEWDALFSINAFLSREIGLRAERTLADVHVLASAYHWSEAAILDLPADRRRSYLALVSG